MSSISENIQSAKLYYYQYVQWCVSFNIYQVKNKNYPKKYWKEQLLLSLQARNKFAVDILKMNRSDFSFQLKLF